MRVLLWGVIMPKDSKYAILVYCGTNFRFVTQLNDGKVAEWDAGQQALLFESKPYAKDIAKGLCWNGFPAMLVEVPNYMENILTNKS